MVFLSTPSARRATIAATQSTHATKFLSTPSARRATQGREQEISQKIKISIHALREEGDGGWSVSCLPASPFLSTPSARRATPFSVNGEYFLRISIHALREEGDGNDN